MEMISVHASLEDAIKSPTAIKFGIDNTPGPQQLQFIKETALNVYDPLVNFFRTKIKIESFYRCIKLNNIVSQSKNSEHITGRAVDLDDDLGGITNSKMFYYIVNNLSFNQLIWEFGNFDNPAWVHCSYFKDNNAKKITIAYKASGNSTIYKHFTDIKDFDKFKAELYKK